MYTCCFVHYIPYLESLGSMFIVAVFFARTPQETMSNPHVLLFDPNAVMTVVSLPQGEPHVKPGWPNN